MEQLPSAVLTNLDFAADSLLSQSDQKGNLPLGKLFNSGGFQWLFAKEFSGVASQWPASPENNFLGAAYLSALENALPKNTTCYYLLAFEKNEAVAGFLIQQMAFNTRESVKAIREANGSGWNDRIKRLLSKVGNFNALVMGNLLLTGQHGYWTSLSNTKFEPLFLHSLRLFDQLASQLGIGAVMVKDFFQRETTLEKSGYHPLNFQPAMLMELPESWKTFDDYVEAMSSKYRVRTRRAFKKGQKIEYRPLDVQEIELRKEALYQLYIQVLESADFNAITAHPDYFWQLKKQLGEDFSLVGCFCDQQLCGFFTTIRNHQEMECHFIGLDSAANREHQIYLNMLYQMVKRGIHLGVRQISFARTALEIKSSIGAVAHTPYSYLRHRNPILNTILPIVVRFMEPREEWTPRHPFAKSE
jgi:hypothetical protein